MRATPQWEFGRKAIQAAIAFNTSLLSGEACTLFARKFGDDSASEVHSESFFGCLLSSAQHSQYTLQAYQNAFLSLRAGHLSRRLAHGSLQAFQQNSSVSLCKKMRWQPSQISYHQSSRHLTLWRIEDVLSSSCTSLNADRCSAPCKSLNDYHQAYSDYSRPDKEISAVSLLLRWILSSNLVTHA